MPRVARPAHISQQTKATIAAASALGLTQVQIAQQVGVHPNSVKRVQADIRIGLSDAAGLAKAPVGDWRRKLTEQLPKHATDAIEKSLKDDNDVHKAAGTGLALLKGLRVLDSDSVTNNVTVYIESIRSMPADMRELLMCTGDVIDVTPSVMESVTPESVMDEITPVTRKVTPRKQ